MTEKQITCEYINPPFNVWVHIQRQRDGFVYDSSDGKFKTEANCTQALIKLPSGTGLKAGMSTLSVDITTQFTDGDYIIYFHDNDRPGNPIVGGSNVSVWNGVSRTTNPVDNAARLLDGMAGNMSVRNTLAAIRTKLGV